VANGLFLRHIGNAARCRGGVADVLFRVLRQIYGEDHVRYARNLTDCG